MSKQFILRITGLYMDIQAVVLVLVVSVLLTIIKGK